MYSLGDFFPEMVKAFFTAKVLAKYIEILCTYT